MSDTEAQKSDSKSEESKPVSSQGADAKRDSDAKSKEREAKRREEEKAAKEQAEQDEADIEAFLSAQRGEKLARGADGSLDHAAFVAKREADREAKDNKDNGNDAA